VVVLAGIGFFVYQAGYTSGTGSTGTQNVSLELATVNTVVGTVESISGQEVTLQNAKRIPEGSADKLGTVVVMVDSATVIERLVQKDVAILNKEMATFIEASKKSQTQTVSAGAAAVVPPEPFTRKEITIGDIKVGDILVAHSAVSLPELSAFTATRIEVQGASEAGTPAVTSAPADAQTDKNEPPPPPIPTDAKNAQ